MSEKRDPDSKEPLMKFEKDLEDLNWTEPDDDEQKHEEFQSQIELMGSNYNLNTNTWHTSLVDAFKLSVTAAFNSFSLEHRLVWDSGRSLNGEYVLQITVRTKDLGQISTEVPVNFIMSPKCPKDLPQQLVKSFEAKFENKRERLIREWTNRKNLKH